MKEYREKFIWGNFIEKIKKEINDMIIDSSDDENENNMPKYNSYYNDNFLDDNDMILDE